MANKENLEFIVKANDEASKVLKDMDGQLESLTKTARNVGLGMMAAGGAMTAGLAMSVKAAAEEEKGIVRLSQAMNNVGLSYDNSRGSLEAWIDAQQQSTAIADSAQRDALAQLITMTGDLTRSQDLLTLAMDISAGTGRDMASVTSTLGYALAGNWGMVQRMLPALADIQTEEEKWMFLRTAFMGQAKEYGKTVGGQIELLKNNIGDLQENIGAVVSEAIAPLVDWLNNLVQGLKDTNPELLKIITMVGVGTAGTLTLTGGFLVLISMIPKVVAGFQAIQTALIALQAAAGPVYWLFAMLAGVIAGVAWAGYQLYQNTKKVNEEIDVQAEIAKRNNQEFSIFAKTQDVAAEIGKSLGLVTKENTKIIETETEAINKEAEALRRANYQKMIALRASGEQAYAVIGEMLTEGAAFESLSGLFTQAYNLSQGKAPGSSPSTIWGKGTSGLLQNYENEDELRAAGVPVMQSGGYMPYTGFAYLHKGETVVPSGGISINIPVTLDGRVLTTVSQKITANDLRLQGFGR